MRGGQGKPLLVLHDEMGYTGWMGWNEELAKSRELIIPCLHLAPPALAQRLGYVPIDSASPLDSIRKQNLGATCFYIANLSSVKCSAHPSGPLARAPKPRPLKLTAATIYRPIAAPDQGPSTIRGGVAREYPHWPAAPSRRFAIGTGTAC